ncbi:MAG: hypothetical protein IKT31_07695 [Firmicutes bacterium]|nr:hypothetical protein [Bacillota bacterium]
MNRSIKSKTLYRFAAVGSILLAVCLVCGMYLMKYRIEGDLQSLEAAASQYAEKNLTVLMTAEIPENTRKENHGIYGVEDSLFAGGYLVALCESEIEGENQWTGPVLFEEGLNGRYRVVESHLSNSPWPVETTSLNDASFGMFGGGDDGGRAVLVLWSNFYPENMAGYQVTYYDVDAYLEDGSIIPLTLDVAIEPESSVHMTCVNIPFNYYDHDHSQYFAYDVDGNEINLREFREANGPLNGDGEGKSGDSGPNMDLYGCILLAGFAAAVWMWKKGR